MRRPEAGQPRSQEELAVLTTTMLVALIFALRLGVPIALMLLLGSLFLRRSNYRGMAG